MKKKATGVALQKFHLLSLSYTECGKANLIFNLIHKTNKKGIKRMTRTRDYQKLPRLTKQNF